MYRQHIVLIDPPTQIRAPVDAIRQFVSRIATRYDICGAALYDAYRDGAIRPDATLNIVVLLRNEPRDPVNVAQDMWWDALPLYLESRIHLTPLPLLFSHWQDPGCAPDPQFVQRIKMKSVYLWL